jgi:hypothetical protein
MCVRVKKLNSIIRPILRKNAHFLRDDFFRFHCSILACCNMTGLIQYNFSSSSPLSIHTCLNSFFISWSSEARLWMGWCGLDCVGSWYTATLLKKKKKAADLHNLTSCFFIPEMTHFDNLATAKYQIFKIKIVRRFKKTLDFYYYKDCKLWCRCSLSHQSTSRSHIE